MFNNHVLPEVVCRKCFRTSCSSIGPSPLCSWPGFESRSGPSLIDAVIIFFYKGINIMKRSAARTRHRDGGYWPDGGVVLLAFRSGSDAGVQTEPGAKTERPWLALHPMRIRAKRGQQYLHNSAFFSTQCMNFVRDTKCSAARLEPGGFC